MAADPGTPAAPAAGGKRKGASRGWRLFRLVVIGALVSAALLIAFPPTGIIKDQLARSIGDAIGRKVTIGSGRLKLWSPLEAEFGQIAVANPEGMPARDVFRAETIKAKVELLPLIKGRVKLVELRVIKPEFALEEDAAGTKNWVFTPTPANAAAPTAASGGGSVPFAPVTTVEQGTLTFTSAKTGAKRAASDINGTVNLDAISGGLTSNGKLVAGGETVAFDVALGDFDAAIAGQSSTLKALIDGRQLKAEIDGDALFSAAAEFTGSLSASSPSLLDLAKWMGAELTPSGEPLKTSLAGKVTSTTRDVTFVDTDVMINTTSSRFNGNLDLGGVRPKLAGTVASEHVDLGRIAGVTRRATLAPEAAEGIDLQVSSGWQALLDDLNALEAGPTTQAEAQPQALAQPEAAAARAGWSEQPFDLKAFKAVDLDLDIAAKEIAYGALDLKNGRVKAAVTDGLVDAKLEQLDVGEGKATGTLALDSRATPPRANVALSLANVAAEPIITEIAGKPLIAGTSNVEISAAATGQNQSQLAATLEGKARFQMGKGAVRGFDVRRMISEWWKNWKFDLAMKTGFEKLEAQYDIKKGVMRSQPDLSIGGGDVEIDAVGSVNVPAKRLNQEIRIKVVPPPTALPIPVRISGDWAKPTIGIDWSGLFGFSAAPSFGAGPSAAEAPLSETSVVGSPQGVAAATEAPPANVQAAIRRVLAADIPLDRLTPEARGMLQSLLPAEPVP